MALRSSWEGFLRLNLISIPVKAFSASQKNQGRVGFHLIHEKCHSRIRYEKVCPIHGPVPNDEIVSGYEVAKGEYVLVQPEELKELRAANDKSINIDIFIKPNDLDPIYYTERSYYLAPDGKPGDKPYAMLHQVMKETKRYAVGTMIMSGRQHVVLVRPIERLLAATFLSFHEQIKEPSTFDDLAPDAKATAQEVKLARTLIEASTASRFDFAHYEDEYAGRIAELVESRKPVKGHGETREASEPAIINLMDAMKQSLQQVRQVGSGKHHRPARSRRPKVAANHRAAGRRKTG